MLLSVELRGFKDYLKHFFSNPFQTFDIDFFTVRIRILEIFDRFFVVRFIFANVEKCRRAVTILSVFFLGVWAFLGFDSSMSQVNYVIQELPRLFLGEIDYWELERIFLDQYGKGMHFSAFTIYGFLFVGTSRYLEKMGAERSENFCLSVSFTLLSVALFEYTWMILYYYGQKQMWILDWRIPEFTVNFLEWGQPRILFQNLVFLTVGLIPLIDLLQNFRLNLDRRTVALAFLTVMLFTVWYFYGSLMPYKPLTVERVGGLPYVNSPLFPQTVYTIDTDLTDNLALGEQFFLEDNKIHFVNTAAKIFFSATLYNILKIKVKNKSKNEK